MKKQQNINNLKFAFFEDTTLPEQVALFPQTRYQGSKRKLIPLLSEVFERLSFDSALDPFCGSGAVAYLLKCLGKRVQASDILASSVLCAKALVANDTVQLGQTTASLLSELPDLDTSPGFVERTFKNIFF